MSKKDQHEAPKQRNKLARLILHRLVEGRCSKDEVQPEKNSVRIRYIIQVDDKIIVPDLKHEPGTEIGATISAEGGVWINKSVG